ncbi:DUF434 domain-containing protein [Echinicola shivajiensis]|uniref:DUF434 domain-containing protein n=1 Tax=Echinicola shivajiensis TaxID=1035916 RepID=UPI001BFC01E9|nr:DUF434 domain-containing protein [Echinicola shivajiensis]
MLRNRGKRSSDDKWFADKWHPIFKEAVNDLCYFLSRGYAERSALQIVGNRYKLNKRQRKAIYRMSCSDEQVALRTRSSCNVGSVKHEEVEIDGFNLLILLESILSGAYVFKGRDGLFRDISSVHGSYRRVLKTESAIILVGNALKELEVGPVKWYFDRPVSNSGRIKTKLLEISDNNGFNWEAELVMNPDKVLVTSSKIVITSDGGILDHVGKWFNLGAYLIDNHINHPNIIAV